MPKKPVVMDEYAELEERIAKEIAALNGKFTLDDQIIEAWENSKYDALSAVIEDVSKRLNITKAAVRRRVGILRRKGVKLKVYSTRKYFTHHTAEEMIAKIAKLKKGENGNA
jgi:hypothetical protein